MAEVHAGYNPNRKSISRFCHYQIFVSNSASFAVLNVFKRIKLQHYGITVNFP